jgi:predicted nucleic acid-binding protein
MNISGCQITLMRVVIDTNAFLSILPTLSEFNSLFWKWIDGKYSILLSNDIYFEYEEIFSIKLNSEVR